MQTIVTSSGDGVSGLSRCSLRRPSHHPPRARSGREDLAPATDPGHVLTPGRHHPPASMRRPLAAGERQDICGLELALIAAKQLARDLVPGSARDPESAPAAHRASTCACARATRAPHRLTRSLPTIREVTLTPADRRCIKGPFRIAGYCQQENPCGRAVRGPHSCLVPCGSASSRRSLAFSRPPEPHQVSRALGPCLPITRSPYEDQT